jgi:biopolymer transport protein ExbB
VNPNLLVDIRGALEKGEFEKVKTMCKDRDSFLTRVVYAGVFSRKEGPQVTRMKMEEEGRRMVELYWNRIGYLSDIGVIAPMLGFLGTVTGMIQSFNAIAFKIGEVKPIYMAYGVSQAMITTAAGLMLGIPAMMFYFFFRGRIQSIAMKAEPVIDSIADYLKKG